MTESIFYLVLRSIGYLYNNFLSVTRLNDVKLVDREEILYDECGLTVCRRVLGKSEYCTKNMRLTITTDRLFIHELAKPASSHIIVLVLDRSEDGEEKSRLPLQGVERGKLRASAIEFNHARSSILFVPYDLGWRLRDDVVLELFSDHADIIARLLTEA
ncbi:MAG: hypothetical protein AB7H80_10420 [Candidatus Kapaibacterium sp.]